MRVKPSHAAEQSTQAVLGTPVHILATESDWYRVEMPDGYTGYMRSNTIHTLSEHEYDMWKCSPRVVCTSQFTPLIGSKGVEGYATYGSILLRDTVATPSAEYIAIITPDGKHLSVNRSNVCPDINTWVQNNSCGNAEDVIALAYTMLGSPYLWGGTSSLAPDCSGFTQISMTAAGILLPRDTSQQIKSGFSVPSINEARRGDLIFYGNNGRVNHVAIYLGEGKIIHSSGHVRICRMNSDTPGSEELFPLSPMAIRRYIGQTNIPGVSKLSGNSWYFTTTY